MPVEDLTLPSLDLRALARRAAVPAAAAAALVAAVLLLGGPLHTLTDAVHRAIDADPAWVVGAAVFELLSFGGYILLLWLVGSRASSRLGLRESTEITLGGAAATRLLPTAGVGGAAMTLWALRRSGLGTRGAASTLLTFLVIVYAVFLGAIALAGGALAVSGEGPFVLTAVPAALATLAMALAVAAAVWTPTEGTGRLRTAGAVLGGSVRGAIEHVRSADPRLLGAFAWWGFDMAVLYGMLNAFGHAPPFAIVVVAYFIGQVANTVPVPGAASGGLVGVLLAFGVSADLAIVAVLAYRARGDLDPGADRARRAQQAAPHDGALGARGRRGRGAGGRGRAAPPARAAAGAGPGGGMTRRPPAALLAVAFVAALGFALTTTGVIPVPDLDEALTDLSDTLGTWTYGLVAALAFLETGAFVGLVAPGETAVVLGGVVAAQGDVSLPLMLLLVWLAAAAGDLASFVLGRRLGRRFLVSHGPRIGVTAPRLARVDGFFERHGAKAILVGRFVGIVRAVAPFLAGASGMRLRTFLPWSLLGTAAWAATFTLVGYVFHASFSAAADYVAHGAFGLAVLAALALAWRAHRLQRSLA